MRIIENQDEDMTKAEGLGCLFWLIVIVLIAFLCN